MALAFAAATLTPLSGFAAGIVTSPTEANLRAALAGGGTVTFATSGTIYLSSVLRIANNTVMDAAGYEITLSGSNVTQVFLVNTNVQFTLNNLTVANGLTGQGAALYNAGTVMMSNVTFSANQALGTNGTWDGSSRIAGPGEPGYGGGIYNAGSVTVISCQFLGNISMGGLSTNNTGPFGAYVVQDASGPVPRRFYKIASP